MAGSVVAVVIARAKAASSVVLKGASFGSSDSKTGVAKAHDRRAPFSVLYVEAHTATEAEDEIWC
jgi:hypothetical protein